MSYYFLQLIIKADLFSGALFIKIAMDVDLYISIGILLVLSALFTIGGGASAVIWTGILSEIKIWTNFILSASISKRFYTNCVYDYWCILFDDSL